MKITFQQAREIIAEINSLSTEPNFKNTKFAYAVDKFTKSSLKKPLEEYNEEIAMARVQNALEDEKTKQLILNEKGDYTFSRDGDIALRNATKEISERWATKEIEVTPFIVETPDLTEIQKELFKGIFID